MTVETHDPDQAEEWKAPRSYGRTLDDWDIVREQVRMRGATWTDAERPPAIPVRDQLLEDRPQTWLRGDTSPTLALTGRVLLRWEQLSTVTRARISAAAVTALVASVPYLLMAM